MRITPEILLKNARDLIEKRARTDRGLLAVYLQGSLLENDPLFGGSADIDLFFIHNENIPTEREIIRLTDAVHLDIAHHPRSLYRQTRTLRLDPWLGPAIAGCEILHDPQHFMDFTQASVRGQFYLPANALARARAHCESARQTWISLNRPAIERANIDEIAAYIRAAGQAANAVASLSGPPLTERRLLLRFQGRAEEAGLPGLHAGLLGLLGAPFLLVDTLHSWLPKWQAAFLAVPAEKATGRLHPQRLSYYLRAFETILASDHPQAVLWPLLRNWVKAIQNLPEDSPSQAEWDEASQQLRLSGPAFSERLAGLDAFLDAIEEGLEKWGTRKGA